MMRLTILLASCVFLTGISNCATIKIKDTEACTALGRLLDGAECAHTLSDERRRLTFEEYVEFLEAKPDSDTEKGHGSAVCQSPTDWNKNITALEQACRMLEKRCSFELKKTIESMREINANR